MHRRTLLTAVACLLLLALTSLSGCVVAAPYRGHGYWHHQHGRTHWAQPHGHGGAHGHWR